MSDQTPDTRDAEPACDTYKSDGHSVLPHCINCGWCKDAHPPEKETQHG